MRFMKFRSTIHLIGGVNDNGDRGLLRRLAGSLLLNYSAAEGTCGVIP